MAIEPPRTLTSAEAAEWVKRLQSPEIAPYWLAAVVDSAEDAIVTKTLDGIITSWNSGARRIFGYTAEEVIGRPVTILIPPENWDEEPSILARLRAGERIEHYETVRRRKDGTLLDISLTVSPIRGADGRIIGASKIARDITEQKRAQETLHAQAEVIGQAYDAIFLRDSSNRITLWNRGAERIYGYAQEEALGRSPHELLKTVPPVPLEEIYEALRREGYWEGELLHTRKDGVQIVAETRWATVRDGVGQVMSILEITRDVTERRRAEASLRHAAAIIENSDDAIISKDLDGIILSWNPGAERLYGYTAEEAVGHPVTMLIPADRPDEEPRILERIRRGERVEHYETVRVTKDGRLRDVSLTVSPVRDATGRVVGASKIARDITERRRAEARLREAHEEREILSRIGQVLSAELDLHKLVQAVTDAATELTGARFGSFFYNVLDEQGGHYMLYTLSGVPRSAFAHFPMPRATDLFGPTFRGEGVIRIADVKQDPRYGKNSPYYGMPEGHLPVTSYLAVPVVSRSGEVLGGLFFGHPDAGVFTERHERLVAGLAAQTAVAMDNARLFEAARAERERAEAAHGEIARLLESITDAFFALDHEWRFTYLNRQAETLLRRERSELLGRVVWEEFPEAGGSDFEEHYRRAVRERRAVTFEAMYQPFGRWFEVRAYPSADGLSVYFHDVTERRRAEDSLRERTQLAELNADVGLALTSAADLREILSRCAAAVVEHLGAAFARIWTLAHGGDLLELQASAGLYTHLDGAHGRVRVGEFKIGRIARERRPHLTNAVPEDPEISDHEWARREGMVAFAGYPLIIEDRLLGVMAMFAREPLSPVTLDALAAVANAIALGIERKRAEEERTRLLESERHARLAAEGASRLKDEFLATVSHELRTPLTAVLGWTHMMRAGHLTGEQAAKALETIERNARAQSQLIDDLLDVSRIITGKLRLDVRPVDPNSFIEAAVAAVQPAAEAKGVRVQKVLDTGIVSVAGDPVRLQQVVWNLLSNAVKFTPRGGRVQVRLERVNSHIEIVVSDTGTGIAPEFLPHVFDRFRQADQKTTRMHGGLGLGLSIVRHLVEMHGGSVRAESGGDGEGATFTVSLPVAPVYQADASTRVHPAARDTLPAYECPDRLDGVRVLVVDDEPDTRELLKIGLGQCGAEVATAASAAEALEALSSSTPDLLISDIGMPGEDGYELIRRVRALPADGGGRVPAVALTAYARAEDRMQALRAGYQMHVPKPVELAELVAVAASLVRR